MSSVNLIGNSVLALIQHPHECNRLRADLTRIGSAVEELLRFAGPLETATERFAREDMTIADVHVPRGAMVYAVIASANRDEEQFANPDRLDLSRDPNRHLAFGHGMHYCVGAPLARLEAQMAIATLLGKAEGLRLAVPETSVKWRPGLVLRGLKRLPVTAVARRGGETSGLTAG